MKHEKAPTAPRFVGVLTISYMAMFWKIQDFGHFWPTSGGRNCQKAHLHTKTFHLNLFTCLYDHRLQRNRLEKAYIKKNLCFWTFWPFSVAESGRNCQKAHLLTNTVHMSLFQGVYDHSLQRNSLEKSMLRT